MGAGPRAAAGHRRGREDPRRRAHGPRFHQGVAQHHCVDLGESFQTHIYSQNFVSIQPSTSPVKFAARSRPRPRSTTRPSSRPRTARRASRRFHGPIGKTLEGSFSAVSNPIFASKYAFESSRRDLHNAFLCTDLKSHFSF